MYITSTGVENGTIHPKYGKHGQQFNENGMPSYSLPVCICEAPAAAVSYVLILEDKDAYPVSGGFVWVHWLVANLKRTEILENESQTATDFLQGANSWMSPQGGGQSREKSSFYGGMAPPDAPHLYELHAFALDKMLDLEPGFYLNELHRQMEGHVLASCTLKAEYPN